MARPDDCQTARLACNGETTSVHSRRRMQTTSSKCVWAAHHWKEATWNVPVHGATACATTTGGATDGADARRWPKVEETLAA